MNRLTRTVTRDGAGRASTGGGGSRDVSRPLGVREGFELALRAGGAGTWRWDLGSGRVHWDAAMEELFGVQPGCFEGTIQAVGRCVHPDDRAGLYAAAERAIGARSSDYAAEHRVVLQDGTVRWVRSTAGVMRDSDGAATELVGVAVDADDRHRLETERASAVSAAFDADRALDAALRRLRLLGRVGDLLDQQPGLNVALRQVADLVVEVLADWCVIDVIEDAQARRGVVAHRDPALAGVAAATRQRAPAPRAAADRPVPEPLFVPDLARHQLDTAVPDPEHRRLLGTLRQPVSYLSLPLLVSGRQLGTMTLVTTDGWQLRAEDVQLAADVAHRFAAVIDTARLTAELARATQLLDGLRATGPLPSNESARRRTGPSGSPPCTAMTCWTPHRTGPWPSTTSSAGLPHHGARRMTGSRRAAAAAVVSEAVAIALEAQAQHSAEAVIVTAAAVAEAARVAADAAEAARAARACAAKLAAEALADSAVHTAAAVQSQADASAAKLTTAASMAAEVVAASVSPGREAEAARTAVHVLETARVLAVATAQDTAVAAASVVAAVAANAAQVAATVTAAALAFEREVADASGGREAVATATQQEVAANTDGQAVATAMVAREAASAVRMLAV